MNIITTTLFVLITNSNYNLNLTLTESEFLMVKQELQNLANSSLASINNLDFSNINTILNKIIELSPTNQDLIQKTNDLILKINSLDLANLKLKTNELIDVLENSNYEINNNNSLILNNLNNQINTYMNQINNIKLDLDNYFILANQNPSLSVQIPLLEIAIKDFNNTAILGVNGNFEKMILGFEINNKIFSIFSLSNQQASFKTTSLTIYIFQAITGSKSDNWFQIQQPSNNIVENLFSLIIGGGTCIITGITIFQIMTRLSARYFSIFILFISGLFISTKSVIDDGESFDNWLKDYLRAFLSLNTIMFVFQTNLLLLSIILNNISVNDFIMELVIKMVIIISSIKFVLVWADKTTNYLVVGDSTYQESGVYKQVSKMKRNRQRRVSSLQKKGKKSAGQILGQVVKKATIGRFNPIKR